MDAQTIFRIILLVITISATVILIISLYGFVKELKNLVLHLNKYKRRIDLLQHQFESNKKVIDDIKDRVEALEGNICVIKFDTDSISEATTKIHERQIQLYKELINDASDTNI